MRLSMLPQLDLYNMRSARQGRIDTTDKERYYLIVFLRTNLNAEAIRDLNMIRTVSDKYPPSRLTVDYVFTNSSVDSALDLTRAGLLAPTSEVYLDKPQAVSNVLHIPTSFPFAFVISGATGEISYSWGAPVQGVPEILFRLLGTPGDL